MSDGGAMNPKDSPAELLREVAARHGIDVDHDRADEFAAYCDAPVKFVEIDMEFPMGECGPADPREVTSQWPSDMTRH